MTTPTADWTPACERWSPEEWRACASRAFALGLRTGAAMAEPPAATTSWFIGPTDDLARVIACEVRARGNDVHAFGDAVRAVVTLARDDAPEA